MGGGHRRRSHWAWGYEDETATAGRAREIAELLGAATGFAAPAEIEEPVPFERARVAAPRIAVPRRLAGICSQQRYDRAVHAHGMAYRDLVRAFRGQFEHAPDVVARPRDEHDVEDLLGWCDDAGLAMIPFGGGTSVVGGVEPRVGPDYAGSVSADLSLLSRVLEADPVSSAARIQAGATGPALNAQLAAHGLTLRHFPQSYEFSTLGGWLATRAGGHYATGPTHIDDLVESVRAITPRGSWQSRRLPGSGAGVSPDRMLLGSEGILGVITEAWLRVQRPPAHQAAVSVRFGSLAAGAEAVRAITGSGLRPSNCRLLDPMEAALAGLGDATHALLMLGFEAADHPVGAFMDAALKLAAGHGGSWDETREYGPRGSRAGATGQWRDAFLRMPYLRNAFPAMGLIAETFESAVTWDRFPAFHETVTAAAAETARKLCGWALVTCRFAFAYPDGPAPYYTVLAQGRRGEEVAQWDAIKATASQAVLASGGTITHHHAVGRDHRPWYDQQRPEPFAAALRAAKAAVDPKAILNPGVLIDPANKPRRPAGGARRASR